MKVMGGGEKERRRDQNMEKQSITSVTITATARDPCVQLIARVPSMLSPVAERGCLVVSSIWSCVTSQVPPVTSASYGD